MSEDAAVSIPGILTGAGGLSFAALLAMIVRQLPPLYKINTDRRTAIDKSEADENAALRARVEKLETKAEEREQHHANELQVMRHRLNNVMMCLDALMLLLETAPDKAAEHVQRIKEMRESQRANEANESAIIAASRTVAVVANSGVPAA